MQEISKPPVAVKINDNIKLLNITTTLLPTEGKVSNFSGDQKEHQFQVKTLWLIANYQKLAKSVERNWGFWINFSLEEVGPFFEVKSKGNI